MATMALARNISGVLPVARGRNIKLNNGGSLSTTLNIGDTWLLVGRRGADITPICFGMTKFNLSGIYND